MNGCLKIEPAIRPLGRPTESQIATGATGVKGARGGALCPPPPPLPLLHSSRRSYWFFRCTVPFRRRHRCECSNRPPASPERYVITVCYYGMLLLTYFSLYSVNVLQCEDFALTLTLTASDFASDCTSPAHPKGDSRHEHR